MKPIVIRRPWNKVARDFTLGLLAFLALVVLLNIGREHHVPMPLIGLFAESHAAAYGSSYISSSRAAVSAFSEPSAAIVTLLSLVFSSLVAFNMWLVRHLCQVHTSARRHW